MNIWLISRLFKGLSGIGFLSQKLLSGLFLRLSRICQVYSLCLFLDSSQCSITSWEKVTFYQCCENPLKSLGRDRFRIPLLKAA